MKPGLKLPLVLLSLLASFAPLVQAIEWPFNTTELIPAEKVVPSNASKSWPVLGKQSALRPGSIMAVWDELPIRYITLTAPNVGLKFPVNAIEQWRPSAKPTGKYSYELDLNSQSQSIFGVSAIPKSFFLRSLDGAEIDAYLASLPNWKSVRVFVNDDSANNPQMISVMGGRTRVLRYAYTSEKKAEGDRAVFQALVDTGTPNLIVFSLECPAASVDGLSRVFEKMVTSFDPITNDN